MSEENISSSSSICVFSNAFLQTNLQILKFSTRLGGINITNSVIFPQNLVLLSCFILLLYCFRLNFNISKLVHSVQVISSIRSFSDVQSKRETKASQCRRIVFAQWHYRLYSHHDCNSLVGTKTSVARPRLQGELSTKCYPRSFYQEVSFIPQFQMARSLQWDNKLLLSIWTLMILSKKSKLGQKSSCLWMVIAEPILSLPSYYIQHSAATQFTSNTENFSNCNALLLREKLQAYAGSVTRPFILPCLT